jgi:ribonuclease HII
MVGPLGADGPVFAVDEVGRGPLAGPVLACAVLVTDALPAGVRDSKALSSRARTRLDPAIRAATPVALAEASPAEIDRLNILEATMLAMVRAIDALAAEIGPPALVLIDGNRLPRMPWPGRAIVGGDAKVPAIAAASIVAKVARDALMTALGAEHPAYGFERHMGYPTAAHIAALEKVGPCIHHRHSFAPVRQYACR